ncbi:MAG: PmoA family protein [Balneolaceae bacterium]
MRLVWSSLWVGAMLLLFTDVRAQAPDPVVVTVSAGDLDRHQTVVRFHLPDHWKAGHYRLQEIEGGEGAPWLQLSNDGEATFVLHQLEAGARRTYRLSPGQRVEPQTPGVPIRIEERTISLMKGGEDVLRYYHRENELPAGLDPMYRRAGYIHPVYSPSGVQLTNHLNEAQHPHHYGIWSAWTSTEFQGRTPDFWNPHNHSGRVVAEDSLQVAWEGEVHAGFRSRHFFEDLSAEVPVIALNESWEVTLYNTGDRAYHQFDLELVQTVNTGQPLALPEYRYGGVGFRGHPDWDDPANGRFLTSEGLGRDGHATRARWVHIGGESHGEQAGIAILSHPENFRHPQTVRIHPDEAFFNYAPSQLGEFEIRSGEPYHARYRYITTDGEPDPEEIERLWFDYAYPPGITVQPE